MKLPSRVGPYALEGLVGRGGMGSVYRGRHTSLNVIRAVKLLAIGNPRRQARFEREARALAEVDHPNVVSVHDAGREGDVLYFAMDLVEGEPLSALLARGKPERATALRLAIGIGRGVDALHAAGIVHRDLKPENVVVDADGRPVVIDLGLALAPDADERLTRTGGMVGTLAYMAPEQLVGAEITQATDVFALGLLLFELLTGENAFASASSRHEILSLVAEARLGRPGDVDPSLPAALDELVASACAKRPGARPQRAGELADALESLVLDGPTAGERRRSRLRATTLLTVAAVAALVALAAWVGTPPSRETDSPAAEAPVEPEAPIPESEVLTPAEIEQGRIELRRLERHPTAAARLRAAEAWLDAHPNHPLSADAKAVQRAARLEVPLRRLQAPAGSLDQLLPLATWVDAERLAFAWKISPVVHLLDARDGSQLERWDLKHGPVRCLYRHDAQRLVATTTGGVYVLGLNGLPGRFLPLEAELVQAASLPNRSALLVGSHEHGVHLLDLESGEIQALPNGGQGSAPTIAVSPDGRWAATGGTHAENSMGFLRLIDLATLELRATLPLRGGPSAAAFSRDGRLLFVGTSSHLLVRIPVGDDGSFGEGERLRGSDVQANLGGGLGGFARSWPAHNAHVRAVTVHGEHVYSIAGARSMAEAPQGLRVWTLDGDEVRKVIDLQPWYSMEVSPEGELLVALGKAGELRIYAGD